jgi:glycogen debranching enzyme
MRTRIEDLFWLETDGTYAQALDGGKCPVSTASSNAGQLLACGVPSAERAARMAARFQEPDFNCGWGLRTLSKKVASYNPMSYHNGSVWPHDNSLIGGGLYRYGEAEAGHLVSTALFDVALRMPMHRLPELYCGFAREGIALDRPVDYPVSCSPQAWASGALPYLVRAMLGMEIDLETKRLSLAPAFPYWLNELTIRDLRVLGREGTLIIRRGGGGYVIDSIGLPLAGAL